jgi:hypothetical protein
MKDITVLLYSTNMREITSYWFDVLREITSYWFDVQKIQIYTNHKNHGTGQLSGTSSFLCVFQSFGRISTSILLTRDWILILTFVQLLISN